MKAVSLLLTCCTWQRGNALHVHAIRAASPPRHSIRSLSPVMASVDVTELSPSDPADYRNQLNEVPGLAVVKFYAPWCRTCR